MTEQEYNAAEGIRRSDLWLMSESAEKFRWHMDNPEDEGAKSPALLFGSACHKMVLEPESWDEEYAVAPSVDGRTKAGKEAMEQFRAENAAKVAVSAGDFQTMAEMAKKLMATPLAARMIAGKHEKPFFWADPETGERCKCKADVVKRVDGRVLIVDYKTTSDARTEVFNQHIFRLGYHVQAAMYTEGAQIALGLEKRPTFFFVAQEKKAPYSVNVIEVGEDVMRYGDSVYHELMRKYHECREVDIWPGLVDDVPNEATLPGWIEMGEEEI